MKKSLSLKVILCIEPCHSGRACAAIAGCSLRSCPSTTQSPIQKSVEAYLRNLYAFDADTVVIIGAPKDIGVQGLLEVDVAGQSLARIEQTGKVYVTKDGKYMFRGEVV